MTGLPAMRRSIGAAILALLLALPASADIAFRGSAGTIVAATTGAASLTGTTSATNIAALKIPANAIGKNGVVEIKALWSWTNSTNAKTLTTNISATSGATVSNLPSVTIPNSTANGQTLIILRNNNATNAQQSYGAPPATTPFGTTTTANNTSAIDTTADTYINFNGTLTVGTETITLQHAYIVVYPAP